MNTVDSIEKVIYEVIDEVNVNQPDGAKLVKSKDTVLFGSGGALDSLGLVAFVVASEQQLEQALGGTIALTDERAMSERNSPFRTIGTLIDYVATLLEDKKDDQ